MRAIRACTLALCALVGAAHADEPKPPAEIPPAENDAVVTPDQPPLLPPTDACCSKPRRLCLTVGQRNWVSFGENSWSFSAPGGHPNVLSQLKWHNIESTVNEFNVDAVWNNRFVVHTDVDVGWLYGGHLRDDDYAGDNRSGLFSDSISPVHTDGLGVLAVTTDFGYRVLCIDGCACGSCPPLPRLTVDALIGYQYWREKDRAVGGAFTVPPFQIGSIPLLTEVFNHHMIRIGGRASWRFLPRASLDSRLMVVPWAYHAVTDYHLQRPDLALPSASAHSQGGFGVMFDSVVTYQVWRGLSLLVGYQLWEITSGHGSNHQFFSNGTSDVVHLNEIDTFRHGLLVGARYRF